MSTRPIPTSAVLVMLIFALGCHPTNRAFRDGVGKNTPSILALDTPNADPHHPSIQQQPERPHQPCGTSTVIANGKPYQDMVATVGHPCIAFLEFDDMGEPFDRTENHQHVGSRLEGRPHELDAALDLIRDSRSYSDEISEDTHQQRSPLPIIVLFIHGWKHNASEPDLNVQGFEKTIRYLSGQPVSGLRSRSCAEMTDSLTLSHQQQCQYANHPIIGIYVGWRGDLVNKYFPATQDLSYFNREAAAERTGSDDLTHALLSISKAAGHAADYDSPAPKPSFLIFVGHSFGGLVLERAVNQAMIREFDRTSAMRQFIPIADLIVYVNSAAAATFSKPMVDTLAQHQARFGSQDADGGNDAPIESKARPLILSVSTPADAATNVVLPIGQTISSLPKHVSGSFVSDDPLACYDPYHAGPAADHFKQSLFYTHSAPHIEQMHSHEMIELVNKQNDGHVSPAPCPETPPALNNGDSEIVHMFNSVPGRCFAMIARRDRCNGTPYWIMRVDKSIIPDHGTIFTGRFLDFLFNFFPTVQPPLRGPFLGLASEPHSMMLLEPTIEGPPTE